MIKIIENFLSDKECSDLLNTYLPTLKFKSGKTAGDKKNQRKSSVSFIDTIPEVDDKLKEVLKENIKLNGWEVSQLRSYQFTEYKVGEYYNWHTDSSNTDHSERFCSIVIQLNDTYEGGELEISNTDKINRKSGTLIMFYSNILHRVLPVTEGTRYSLVNWLDLNKVKSNDKRELI
jgi:PKHD-type hydroxylase